ncbi:hypothetical protein BDR22DRAFT_252616 [Usnea florida]
MLGKFTSLPHHNSFTPSCQPRCLPLTAGECPESAHRMLTSSSKTLWTCDTSAPEPGQLRVRLAEMHRKSNAQCGMFGVLLIKCDAKLPYTVAWEASWAIFLCQIGCRAC